MRADHSTILVLLSIQDEGVRRFRSLYPLQRKCIGVHSYVHYDTTETHRQRYNRRRDQYCAQSEYALSNMIQQTSDNEDRIKVRWKKCIYKNIHGPNSTEVLIFTGKFDGNCNISTASHDSPFIFNDIQLIDNR